MRDKNCGVRPETREREATCWVASRLDTVAKGKELFHPVAIECSHPVCID